MPAPAASSPTAATSSSSAAASSSGGSGKKRKAPAGPAAEEAEREAAALREQLRAKEQELTRAAGEHEAALACARADPLALRDMDVGALEALQGELLASLARVEKAAREKRAKEKECQICMANDKNTVLNPCGHQVCAACATQIRGHDCPFCKQRFRDTTLLFS